MTLGERIKLCRKRKGITQAELARKCGVNRTTINHYEHDIREPTLLNAMCVADALGISLEYLAKGEARK